MPRGVRKKANSADPRDWNYLAYWQGWQTFMPPYQYLVRCRSEPPAPGFALWDRPVCFPSDPIPGSTDSMRWKADVSLPDFDPPYTSVLCEFVNTIAIQPPGSPILDPDGNPFTLSMAGHFDLPGLERASWTGYSNLPAYLEVFTWEVKEPGGDEHPFYPFGIQFTPAIWNHPALTPV